MAGKGDGWRKEVDWKKWHGSKLWNNIGPSSRKREHKSKPIPNEDKEK
jgi:hypothetical protein